MKFCVRGFCEAEPATPGVRAASGIYCVQQMLVSAKGLRDMCAGPTHLIGQCDIN